MRQQVENEILGLQGQREKLMFWRTFRRESTHEFSLEAWLLHFILMLFTALSSFHDFGLIFSLNIIVENFFETLKIQLGAFSNASQFINYIE